jgi:hypothetical protein
MEGVQMSDHIPDVTKMIGETPRMKAAQMAAMEHMTGDVYRVGCDIERELNAANERISKLNDYVAALETAGDLMANELSYGYDVDMWNKAKEAKP